MRLPIQKLSRRTFLRRAMQFGLAAVVCPKFSANTKTVEAAAPAAGYGVGRYGASSYPGSANQVFLPFIGKED